MKKKILFLLLLISMISCQKDPVNNETNDILTINIGYWPKKSDAVNTTFFWSAASITDNGYTIATISPSSQQKINVEQGHKLYAKYTKTTVYDDGLVQKSTYEPSYIVTETISQSWWIIKNN